MPFFSIVTQSTLKSYPGAASNRPEKLVRAIESVIAQTFDNWEMVIIADDCQESFDIAVQFTDKRIKAGIEPLMADKWHSYCRNIGKGLSTGRFILYLDNDDYYAPDYLQNLFEAINEHPAVWYIADHYEWHKDQWKLIRARLTMNSAGTANIIHSSKMLSRWPDSGTRGNEDWQFIKRLINESGDYKHLDVAGYYVAHIMGKYDV